MVAVIPLVFFYFSTFIPTLFKYRELCIIVIVILLIFINKYEGITLLLFFFITTLSVFSASLSYSAFSSPLLNEDVVALSGKVSTESVRKNNRKSSYTLTLSSVLNSEGDIFSAEGNVFVISNLSDVTINDEVLLRGHFEDNYFYAESTEIRKQSLVGKIRRKVNTLFISMLPKGEDGNVISSLLSGTSLTGKSEIVEKARSYGLSYLFALSGMHLAILNSIFLFIFRRFTKEKIAKFISLSLLFIFVFLTGYKPSLIRSFIFIVLLSFFETPYAFTFSLLLLLKFFPSYVREVSIVLSFTTLSGIILLSKGIKMTVNSFFPFFSSIVSLMSVSLASIATSTPIVLKTFGEWNPFSFLYSIPGVIVIYILFFVSLLSLIISPLKDVLGFITRYLILLPEPKLTGSIIPYYFILGFVFLCILFYIFREKITPKVY